MYVNERVIAVHQEREYMIAFLTKLFLHSYTENCCDKSQK